MNRNALSAALAVVVVLVVLASSGCQPSPDTNRNAAATNTSPVRETVDTAAIEAELIKLEREWAAAVKNRDAEAVRRILADDAVITYPDGVTGTKADEVQSIETGAITADSWELLDPKVTVINADAAFIIGRGIIKNGKYKDPKVAKPIDISGEYRFLDVYARRNGRWQAVASQTTPIKNPVPAASPAASVAAPSPSAPVRASPTATATPARPAP
jgi:ketosteroid isomerase-like protein